ncbi:MAG: chemotaxis protein CheX [Bdellovibrionota bacterium]
MSIATSTDTKGFLFDTTVAKAITTGVKETLFEMCRLPCDFESSFVVHNWSPIGNGSGRIDLYTDDQRGMLQLHFTEDAALAIMAKLLGRSPMFLNEDTLDCIGALTGVIYGRMKAILNPMGYKFLMALPEMQYTEKLSRPEGDVRHLIIPFKVASSKCYIQMVYYV